MTTSPELVGLAEIADEYAIALTTAHGWTRHPTFPAPVVRLRATGVWQRADVAAWVRDRAPRALAGRIA